MTTAEKAAELTAWFARQTRADLREMLRACRIDAAHPYLPNPRAAQLALYGVTTRRVCAEYRRRGWKIPKKTRAETSYIRY